MNTRLGVAIGVLLALAACRPQRADPCPPQFVAQLDSVISRCSSPEQFQLRGNVLEFKAEADIDCFARVSDRTQVAQDHTPPADFAVRWVRARPGSAKRTDDLHILNLRTGAALVILFDTETGAVVSAGLQPARGA
ncbi:MAG: hypothetical protein SFY70_05010 [Bacteroidia bacterium]|nr:hypothetical protein [Bacteroidia bacterium]